MQAVNPMFYLCKILTTLEDQDESRNFFPKNEILQIKFWIFRSESEILHKKAQKYRDFH
jgi:hypothetical protein